MSLSRGIRRTPVHVGKVDDEIGENTFLSCLDSRLSESVAYTAQHRTVAPSTSPSIPSAVLSAIDCHRSWNIVLLVLSLRLRASHCCGSKFNFVL